MVASEKLGDINQKYGSEGGDQIVNGLSEYLKENVEADEKLVHIDGANFVVIVPKGDQPQAKRRTRQIRAQVVSRHFECGGEAVRLTLSMGVIIQPAEPQGAGTKVMEVAEDLLSRMGVAHDQAKKQGGDKVVEDFVANEA